MPDNTKRWKVTAKNTHGSSPCWDFLYKTTSDASMSSVVADLTQNGYELVSVQLLPVDPPPPSVNATRQIDVFGTDDPRSLPSRLVRFWDGG